MAAIPLASLLHPLLSHSFSDPFDVEEDFEECNTLTVLDYGDLPRQNQWMTPEYLSLQLRCAGLMRNEAQRALRQHFRGESSEKLQILLNVGKNRKLQEDRYEWLQVDKRVEGNSVEGYDCNLLPTSLAVPIHDEALTKLLEKSLKG